MVNLKVVAPLNTSAWLSLSTPETVTGLAPRMEKPSSPSTRERVTVRGEDQLWSAENAGSGPCAHKEMLKHHGCVSLLYCVCVCVCVCDLPRYGRYLALLLMQSLDELESE